MNKDFSKDQCRKIASPYFKKLSVDTLFVTPDGQVFTSNNLAKMHAGKRQVFEFNKLNNTAKLAPEVDQTPEGDPEPEVDQIPEGDPEPEVDQIPEGDPEPDGDNIPNKKSKKTTSKQQKGKGLKDPEYRKE